MPRLFVSLPIPDDVRRRLADVQAEWRTLGLPCRWARPAGLHVTLAFLGERPDDDVPRLALALAGAVSDRPPIPLHVEGTGAFPSLERPRVIWAGLGGDLATLSATHRAVGSALRAAGVALPGQPRAPAPHVTLGRLTAAPAPELLHRLRGAIVHLQGRRFGSWTAPGVHLMRSELRAGGAVYTSLSEVFLAGAKPAQEHPAPVGAPA